MLVGHQPKEFLLAVEALTVSFDGFKAVNDLSFYVDENEIRVIIGPNGAGKTTVLDLICGKTKATSTKYRITLAWSVRMSQPCNVRRSVMPLMPPV